MIYSADRKKIKKNREEERKRDGEEGENTRNTQRKGNSKRSFPVLIRLELKENAVHLKPSSSIFLYGLGRL